MSKEVPYRANTLATMQCFDAHIRLENKCTDKYSIGPQHHSLCLLKRIFHLFSSDRVCLRVGFEFVSILMHNIWPFSILNVQVKRVTAIKEKKSYSLITTETCRCLTRTHLARIQRKTNSISFLFAVFRWNKTEKSYFNYRELRSVSCALPTKTEFKIIAFAFWLTVRINFIHDEPQN